MLEPVALKYKIPFAPWLREMKASARASSGLGRRIPAQHELGECCGWEQAQTHSRKLCSETMSRFASR